MGRLLGAGGFSSVWSATSADGSLLAVKVAEAEDGAAARLAAEAQALARVGPPHVPAVVQAGALGDGRPYLVMQQLAGPSLAGVLAGWSELPALEERAAIAGALLDAAAAVHARGLCHRDLKPENAFLSLAEGTVTCALIDFGLTEGDRAAGTPEYMAPEQIEGRAAGPAADVYALGVMLYELATGRVPFAGDRRSLEYAHLSLRPPRPSRFAPVPGALEAIVLRCLAKAPAARFTDADELRTAVAGGWAGGQLVDPAGQARPTAAAAGAAAQRAALLFIDQPGLAPAAVQAAVQPFGGLLAHLAGRRCACTFTHPAGEHPARRALAAAQALFDGGLARRVVLDLASVTVKPRPGGPPRVLSPLFTEATRYPDPEADEGITVAPAARDSLRAREQLGAVAPAAGRAPLQGREDELAALLAEAMRATGARRPAVATVLGEGGMGKTRLALELGERLANAGLEVVRLTAREPLGSDADEPLAELLRRGLELGALTAADGPAILLERLGHDSQQAVAAAALLGWIPADDPWLQALRSAPGALRANVARAGQTALHRLAARRPVVVLLDEAHLADDALLDALELCTVAELPLWVCALGRPSFATSRPGWGQRAPSHQRRQLEPLDRDAAAALCRALLAPVEAVPARVVDRLVDRSGGVPLRLQELVRGLRQRGLVRQQAGGVWFVASEVLDQLSDSPLFEWLAKMQLDQLPADLAAHARLVALLAPEFSVEEVAGVLAALEADVGDGFPLDAAVGNDRLQALGLLERRGARHAFAADLVREAIAATVGESLAGQIHRAALAHYRASTEAEGTRLPRLARHAAAAGARAEAAAAYLASAERARERHAYLEADMLYSRALGQLDQGDQAGRLRALGGRGIMRYRLGRHDDALEDLAQASEMARALGDPVTQAHVMLDESTALDWLFEWQRSRELAEAARDLVAGQEDVALQARVQLALGRSLHRFNRDHEAAVVLRQAAALAEACGDAGYEDLVAAELLLGFLLPFIGVLDEAEQRLGHVERLCQRTGDELHLAAMWNNRSCLWIARNDRQRFLADVERVQAHARQLGNVNLDKQSSHNLAYFMYWRGEYAEAVPAVQRMIAIDERYFRQGELRPDGAVLLARIHWCAGAEPQAAALVAEVRAHQAAARVAGKTELLLPPNEELLLDMTGLLVENAGADAWEALVARAGQVAQGQELIEVLELAGLAAQRRGEPERAERWWRQALQSTLPNVMRGRIAGRLRELETAD